MQEKQVWGRSEKLVVQNLWEGHNDNHYKKRKEKREEKGGGGKQVGRLQRKGRGELYEIVGASLVTILTKKGGGKLGAEGRRGTFSEEKKGKGQGGSVPEAREREKY